MNKKLDRALTIIQIVLLIILIITYIIYCKVILKENKQNKPENLIIEELVEIYDSEVYTYTFEELPNAQEHIKYACIVKFYDGKHYTERIMSVAEDNFVYTEIVIEDKEFN